MAGNWKGRNVFVTGANGFVGSWVAKALVESGANVTALIRDVIPNSNLDLSGTAKKLNIVRGSVTDLKVIERAFNEYGIDTCFHLAAQAYVNKSFEQPLEVIKTNDWGTLMVLEAIRQTECVKQAVFTSSSEIYGSYDQPIKEEFPLNPTSPYGASKAAADRYCFSYWNTYNLPVSIIRPFNTYGPRHTYDVVPKFIKLALENKNLTIYGDGQQTRDLLYVDDTVEAFLIMASNKKAVGQAINFGTGKDIKIIDLAEKIIKLSNSNSKIVHLEKRLSEVKRLCCDYSKAEKMFDWEPKVPLVEGLKRNIQWELEHR